MEDQDCLQVEGEGQITLEPKLMILMKLQDYQESEAFLLVECPN